jgi:hypothetical protein
MQTIRLILISVVCIAAFIHSEKLARTTWMSYEETKCADPWYKGNVAKKVKVDNIESYLASKGVKVFDVKITDEGTFQPCQSCGCKTGKIIKAKTKENDTGTLKNEGFY